MDESKQPLTTHAASAGAPAMPTSSPSKEGSAASSAAGTEKQDPVLTAAQHIQYDRMLARESKRLQIAWGKLGWLLSFLAILLAVSYILPRIVESLQYAATRGQQRAKHELAKEDLQRSILSTLSDESQKVSECVSPSVVHIHTLSREGEVLVSGMPMRNGMGRGRMPLDGQGSGFVIDARGYIVTNYHVVADAKDIQVALSDGRKVTGTMVGFDRETDIAVVQIQAESLVAAEWGDSDKAEVGSMVWAMGSPFGLTQSITSGILSGKHRAGMAGTPYQDFLQTDAAVNPGNSGGPLVDTHGKIIGVNSAIVGEAYQGISFAVPSNLAKEVVARVRSEGKVRRGWLGISMEQVSEERALRFGMPGLNGVLVTSVVTTPETNAPAYQAGIRVGDVVTHWNGSPVRTPAELSNLVAKTEIGSKATVTIMRDGAAVELSVTVGERPQQ